MRTPSKYIWADRDLTALSDPRANPTRQIYKPRFARNYCRSFCKFKAWCLHSTGEVSFLPATSITVSLYLHHLLEIHLVALQFTAFFTLLTGYIS